MKLDKKYPIACFEQYVQTDGRRFTFGYELFGKMDAPSFCCPFPNSIAIFKVYLKKEYSFLDKLFHRDKKEIRKHIAAWHEHKSKNNFISAKQIE